MRKLISDWARPWSTPGKGRPCASVKSAERVSFEHLRVKQWHGLRIERCVGAFCGNPPRNHHSQSGTLPAGRLPVCLAGHGVRGEAGGVRVRPLVTLLLLIYGYRVLGKTEWLRRLGWVSPRQGFWFYSLIAGVAAAGGVWWFARIFHQSLGGVPPPQRVLLASFSGPMIEEMLFRGLLFWLIFELFRRRGVPQSAAAARDSLSHGNCLRVLPQ